MQAWVRYAGPSVAAPGRVTLTMDASATRNALSRQLVTELVDALHRAGAADGVRVVVVEAAGPAFCSGVDLGEARAGGMDQGSRALVGLQRTMLALPVPVVTRVHGPVRAGGIGLVAASDVALSADEASYAFTEVRLGLAAAVIGLTVLPRMSGRAAAEALLTGRVFGGQEAAAAGLVTRSVPLVDLDGAVDEVCDRLAQAHPQGLRETKRLLTREALRRLETEGDEMAALSARLFSSPAAREAMAAFLDR